MASYLASNCHVFAENIFDAINPSANRFSKKMIAMHPRPAGATESLLSLEAWEKIRAQNRSLQTMEPDVEALLVNRLSAEAEYFIVPIDECFRLVGIIRMQWKGLSGGVDVCRHIQQFSPICDRAAVIQKSCQMRIFEVSSKSGQGVDQFCSFLCTQLETSRMATVHK